MKKIKETKSCKIKLLEISLHGDLVNFCKKINEFVENSRIRSFLLFASYIFSFVFATGQQLPAFPGAEGFGTHTPGGRGGIVYKVINLNDSGPGSLREAIEANGKRIVVFDVGGYINLETPLILNNPYITIAGQTAPGMGICIRGEGLRIMTHDVIIRFLRIRPSDLDFGAENNWAGVDALGMGIENKDNVYNIVIDHCSLSWAVDENLSFWFNSHDITVQNSIISEALNASKHPKGPHSMGVLIGDKSTNISLHKNILANNNNRNPLFIADNSFVDFRNNIIFNPGGQIASIQKYPRQTINFINNNIISGPNTTAPHVITFHYLDRYDQITLNIFGNIFNQDEIINDNYSNFILYPSNTIPPSVNTDIEFEKHTTSSIKTLNASSLKDSLFGSVGASVPYRDQIDYRVLHQLESGKGKIRSTLTQIDWPFLYCNKSRIDSDNDGMADNWEMKYKLDYKTYNPNEDYDLDGYTNLEEYLNGTSPIDEVNEVSFSHLKHQISDNILLIKSIFPNPTRDKLNIEYSMSVDSPVEISLTASNGSTIILAQGNQCAGLHFKRLDLSAFNAGLYSLCIEVNSVKSCEKMILIE